MTESRTIAAAATPPGVGGIAVIRVSGADAVNIVDRVFSGGASHKEAKSHTVHYGHIIGKDSEPVDEVLVTVMLAPKSYTGENVVEIGTHGGLVASKNVLRRLIEAGAYPADQAARLPLRPQTPPPSAQCSRGGRQFRCPPAADHTATWLRSAPGPCSSWSRSRS